MKFEEPRSRKAVVVVLSLAAIAIGSYFSMRGLKALMRPATVERHYRQAPARPAPPPSHEEAAGVPTLTADANDLKQTLVVPHLEQPIEGNKNVLWCATFQICWNELCDLFGEDIHMENEPPMIAALNKRLVRPDHLDPSSYVATAGIVGEGIFEKIDKLLEEKFDGQASPKVLHILKQTAPPGYWLTYCYLFKNLPFQWKFDRLSAGIEFAGIKVSSFGIVKMSNSREILAGGQVDIYDYKDPDDFVITIRTKSVKDRLVLAKIRPGPTLLHTINTVSQRLKNSKVEDMLKDADLKVPVLNFDLMRQYSELYGQSILLRRSSRREAGFVIALQRIRFRLDETGAVLLSEAGAAGGVLREQPKPKHLIFDKPFLIMISRRDQDMPYFVLWVANTELLVPIGPPVDTQD